MNQTKKRARIDSIDLGTKVQERTEKKEFKIEAPEEEVVSYFDESGEFDWDAFEATCPKRTRKPNPHIKTKNGDRVYSRELYAQELYDAYEGNDLIFNVKPTSNVGEIVDGKVYAVTEEWITVDAKFRELVYIKTSKEPQSILDACTPGAEVSLLILPNEKSKEGGILGSISGGMKQRTFKELVEGIETEDTAWVGKVSHMIENGGYIVNIKGIECFMPGSLAGINKLHDFSSIIGTEIYVVPVSHSVERGTIVVSHRKYLQAMIPTEIENLKTNIDNKITGKVTGSAKYGVFCEFNNCLTGMIHSNDLDDETSAKHKSREIKPGDVIEFWVKDIVSNSKITLSQRAENISNPWKDIEKRFKVPCDVNAVVKTKKEYGLFISIEEGLVGLLHVSEFPDGVIDSFNPGDNITVQVNRIEKESQKIYLKLSS